MAALDASAVARGTGIETDYKDLSGGKVRFLPQRIALLAPGESGVSYSTTKFQVTSGAAQVGSVAGYRSLAYAGARELFPVNGGGVGTIPVDVFLLEEGASATQAAGDVSGTGSAHAKAAEYTPIVAGVRYNKFSVPKLTSIAAGDWSDIYEKIRQSIEAKASSGSLAQATHTYGTVAATAGGSNTGDGTVSGLAVSSGASPKAGTWRLTCTAEASDAGTFKLVDPDGYTVKSDITVGVAQSNVGGLDFTVGDGTEDWDVDDYLDIEVPSTGVDVTLGSAGSFGNDATIQIEGPSLGITWVVTQPTGGTVNPTVDAALAQIGDVHNTLIVNMLEPGDTAALDALQAWGGNPEDETGRWAPTVKKPAFAVVGSNAVTVDAATIVSDARATDNVNCQIPVPGSPNLPGVIAAAAAREIVKRLNNAPGQDFGGLKLTTITPGTDAQQWNYAQRDAAIKRGSSTTEKRNGVVVLSDTVTMYKPVGEEPPAYRYVVDIGRLQNCLYNIDLEFSGEDWEGKILIQDGQPTNRSDARTPAMAIGAMFAIIDNLALAALITDPAFSKEATTAAVNGPKRLDIGTTLKLSGNTNQKAVSMNWGFFFGG